jgi:hypothetical protein
MAEINVSTKKNNKIIRYKEIKQWKKKPGLEDT